MKRTPLKVGQKVSAPYYSSADRRSATVLAVRGGRALVQYESRPQQSTFRQRRLWPLP